MYITLGSRGTLLPGSFGTSALALRISSCCPEFVDYVLGLTTKKFVSLVLVVTQNSAGFSAGEAQLLIETSLDFGMKVNNL